MGGAHRRYLSLMAHGMRTWEGQGKGEMGQKVTCSDESCYLGHHVGGQVHVNRLRPCLPACLVLSPGCTLGRIQPRGGSGMIWTRVLLGTFLVGYIHGVGSVSSAFKLPRGQSVGCVRQTSPFCGGSTSPLPGLQGSARQHSSPSGVKGRHDSVGQGCLGSEHGKNTLLDRCFFSLEKQCPHGPFHICYELMSKLSILHV